MTDQKTKTYEERLLEARDKMTGKRRVFCEAYVSTANFSPLWAAREAKYKRPHEDGYRLMHVPEVKAYIEVLLEGTRITEDEIHRLLNAQATFDPTKYYRVEERWEEKTGFIVDPETGESKEATVLSLESRYVWIDVDALKKDGYGHLIKKFDFKGDKQHLTVEFYDSQKALELLGKAKGMFVDRHEIDMDAPVKTYVSFDPAMWDKLQADEGAEGAEGA